MTKHTAMAAMAMLWALALPAFAQATKGAQPKAAPAAAPGAKVYAERYAALCAACHGADGRSEMQGVPCLLYTSPSPRDS